MVNGYECWINCHIYWHIWEAWSRTKLYSTPYIQSNKISRKFTTFLFWHLIEMTFFVFFLARQNICHRFFSGFQTGNEMFWKSFQKKEKISLSFIIDSRDVNINTWCDGLKYRGAGLVGLFIKKKIRMLIKDWRSKRLRYTCTHQILVSHL